MFKNFRAELQQLINFQRPNLLHGRIAGLVGLVALLDEIGLHLALLLHHLLLLEQVLPHVPALSTSPAFQIFGRKQTGSF